jgi:hypothetical protein
MKTFLLLLILAAMLPGKNRAQTQADIKNYYNLGLQYKNGNGVAIDYTKAYNYFLQAANLGDAQSIYAVAYMNYKGLGCTQNYSQASALFAQGAFAGRDNSMYFYGLCFRNGYGITKNDDSAKYWLGRAAATGYKQAIQELATAGENSNNFAKALVQQISNEALEGYSLSQFPGISPHLSGMISGNYTGYLIQYDWSGQNVVNSRKLNFTISGNNGGLTGKWVEDASDSATLTATINNDTIVFTNTSYRRKDYYSPDSAILYNFGKAYLNFVEKSGSYFLAGSVTMFSPEREEPSKPLVIALSQTPVPLDIPGGDGLNNQDSAHAAPRFLSVYPNPFGTTLNVQVALPMKGQVALDVVTMSGQTAYHLDAGTMLAGTHLLSLQVGHLAPATYLLVINYNGYSESVRVVKK